jgi:hypothetical protein
LTPKPQRTLRGRVSAYADEATGFVRRRRMTRKPFARVTYGGGQSEAYSPDTAAGRELFAAAAKLIDAAG